MDTAFQPASPPLDAQELARKEEEDENRVISSLCAPGAEPLAALEGLDFDAPIDQSGKADDALDFEDIDLSDEELLDTEEPTRDASAEPPAGLTDDAGTASDTDDLFGDGPEDAALNARLSASSPPPAEPDASQVFQDDSQVLPDAPPAPETQPSIEELRLLNFDHDESHDQAPPANQDLSIPAPAENLEDFVKQQWPGFEKDIILNWNDLLPARMFFWKRGKKPLRPPKPLIPAKHGLEIDADQEKLFRVPGPAAVPGAQIIQEASAKGLVSLEDPPEPVRQADLDVFNVDAGDDLNGIGGFTLSDMTIVCDNWESAINTEDGLLRPPLDVNDNREEDPDGDQDKNPNGDEDSSPDDDAAWDEMFLDDHESEQPRRRKAEIPQGLPPIPRFTAPPNFDDFPETTAKLGKRVILDMNDPYLLIDDVDSDRAVKRRKVQHKMMRMANGDLRRDLGERFNFSNDEAYDALKENNSNRVRATILQVPVQHSMPALRLLWPYYLVRLKVRDPLIHHRHAIVNRHLVAKEVGFERAREVRKKDLKGKKIKDIFRDSRDLVLNDNSTAVLFEYCEEVPTVLSNLGMGNRILNYYRRAKSSDDRPAKRELGEATLLLPEDKSPFAQFGQVHPGETVPTLYNNMFRAPIFKHTPRSTDFLVGRSTIGAYNSVWYIRNIDHLYVVGQTLPSMEVPGPHSRRVTNIAKNRLKMVSYRLMRKHPSVSLQDITRHIADSNESQNRQKLKEFLRFRKDTKDWALPEGQELMDEAAIRSLIKPEDVCLLDSMQVGAYELENGGFEVSKDDDPNDPDGAFQISENELAAKMTPWKTTRAFIEATSGKAMLAVHGPGDPTGRGLGISFIKTSMKGGYLEQLRGPLASSADAMEQARRQNNGHAYNVKNQDTLYHEALVDIWSRQRASLEDTTAHDDDDVQPREDEDDRFNLASQAAPTPAAGDGVSQISRPSAVNGVSRRKLKITRTLQRPDGTTETHVEIVHDPVVIAQYIKRRKQAEVENIDIFNVTFTGNKDKDALIYKIATEESERLKKNRERSDKREKQKKLLQWREGTTSVPGAEGSPEPGFEKTGTTRKCANCGQVGHIKTNKKLCPLLNGTITLGPSRDEIDNEPSTGNTLLAT